MKVIITGGAGFLGQHLAEHLKNGSNDVLVIDNLIRAKAETARKLRLNGVDVKIADIQSRKIAKVLHQWKPDAIVHAAALTSVEESIREPELYNRINATGTLQMLRASLEAHCDHFVYISSAAVYGNPEYLPINEKHPLKPLSPYGASKMAGEVYTHAFGNYSLKTAILRLFNIYGSGQNLQYAGVIAKFLELLKQGKPPVIFGDGEQTRDFIHVSDVTNAIGKVIEIKAEGTFNVASGMPVTVNTLAQIMIRKSGAKMRAKHVDARPGDIKHSYADVNNTSKQLRWKPTVGLDKGLTQLSKDFGL